MKLMDFFPYRNDLRKTLIPYLEVLPEEAWFQQHPNHPNTVAWMIRHIVESEDGWIHVTGRGMPPAMRELENTPDALIAAYVEIRRLTDEWLTSLSVEEGNRLIHVPEFADGWKPPSPPTWRWVFHHVYAHEAYHVGQIGVIARLNGFRGPHF